MGINRGLVPSGVPRASLLGAPWFLRGTCPHVGLGSCTTVGLLCGEMASPATAQGPVSSCWILSGLGLQLLSCPGGGLGGRVVMSPPALGHTLRWRVKSSLDLHLHQSKEGLCCYSWWLLERPGGEGFFFHSLCPTSLGGEGLVGRWFNGKLSLVRSKYQSDGW